MGVVVFFSDEFANFTSQKTEKTEIQTANL